MEASARGMGGGDRKGYVWGSPNLHKAILTVPLGMQVFWTCSLSYSVTIKHLKGYEFGTLWAEKLVI